MPLTFRRKLLLRKPRQAWRLVIKWLVRSDARLTDETPETENPTFEIDSVKFVYVVRPQKGQCYVCGREAVL